MAYIPRTKEKGKHYYVYSESGKKKIPTKAELLRRALEKAKSIEDHAKFIDFIPARFTAQIHSWVPPTSPIYQYKTPQEKLKYINKVVLNSIKKGGDFVHEIMQTLGGKAHVDIRVQKLTAPCFDKETEVLTDHGWKKFKDIKDEDLIAKYLKDKKEIIYSKHYGLYQKDYKGTMIGIKTDQIDMLVTPNHRIFFNQEIIEAQDVYGKTGIFQAVIPKQKSSFNIDLFYFPQVKRKDWFKTKYSDKVYCLNIPGDPLIVVRRNGKVLISGRSWFGWTLFRSPMLGTPERKIMGSIKGYQALLPQGRKLEKFLAERAQKAIAAGGGIAERQDKLEWLDVKSQWFPIGSTGNPQKNEDAFMVAWEYKQPAVLHRREIDFIDCTFLGKYLRGRYYYRLVERALSEDELTKEQKQNIAQGKAKAYYGLFFYWWKSKTQFDLKEMEEVALGKKVKEPIPAPPKKD